jgi:hypothetical protein
MSQRFRLFRIGLAVGLSLAIPLLGTAGCSAGSASDVDDSIPTGSGATGGGLGTGGTNPGSGGSGGSIGTGATGGSSIITMDGGLPPGPETCELDCTPAKGRPGAGRAAVLQLSVGEAGSRIRTGHAR